MVLDMPALGLLQGVATAWQSLSQVFIHTGVLLLYTEPGIAQRWTTNEVIQLDLIHCPTVPKKSTALCWKIPEVGKGKTCGMPKYCDKLNFTHETRQIQDLVWTSCLPGSEVLRKADVTSREEILCLLRHFVFNHCWPRWVWRLLKPECRARGQAQLSWQKHP